MVRTHQFTSRRAFTITEMLVTVGVIVVLAGILVISLSAAARSAQRGKTDFLMQTLKSGIGQFEADHGYLPPVLGYRFNNPSSNNGRDLLALPESSADVGFNAAARQYNGWYSMTSLPEFLLGYGDRVADGYGYINEGAGFLPPDDSLPGHREHPGLGIRSPGPDGFWNATLNPKPGFEGNDFRYAFDARNPGNLGGVAQNAIQVKGKIYGPYIDLKDDSVIGELVGLQNDNSNATVDRQVYEQVLTPGSDGYGFGNNPKVFLDYWGSPIRYYRKPPQNISNPSLDRLDLTLGDIIVLRPFSIFEQGEAGQLPESGFEDAVGDTTVSRELLSAEFALFSPGPDRRSYDDVRVTNDDDQYNQDNIVRVGP
ncbi:MAG: type II secretion system GspH family protein [Phycisphaerales bacterium]|nr:type II secretion system GspH family protein [Phycisphaerales bacterium]